MQHEKATACANPNIALIKYWGNRDHALRIPANSSLSMNMGGLTTTTTVAFDDLLRDDVAVLDGVEQSGASKDRIVKLIDRVRALAGLDARVRVESRNNFPSGAGLASSASGFAALAVASTAAGGLHLDEASLSRLARVGSGSACRSVPAGRHRWGCRNSANRTERGGLDDFDLLPRTENCEPGSLYAASKELCYNVSNISIRLTKNRPCLDRHINSRL